MKPLLPTALASAFAIYHRRCRDRGSRNDFPA